MQTPGRGCPYAMEEIETDGRPIDGTTRTAGARGAGVKGAAPPVPDRSLAVTLAAGRWPDLPGDPAGSDTERGCHGHEQRARDTGQGPLRRERRGGQTDPGGGQQCVG